MTMAMPTKVLFVCLGNICRSPMAEGLFRHLASQAGYSCVVDSAGTGSWHVGEAPDPRAVACMQRFGIDISNLRARQVHPEDFKTFEIILAMDAANLKALEAMRKEGSRPRLFTEMCQLGVPEIPDPYYGGPEDFERVFRLLHTGLENLISQLHRG